MLEGLNELIGLRPVGSELLAHFLFLLDLDEEPGVKLVAFLFSFLEDSDLLLEDADFIILLIEHNILFPVSLDLHLVDSGLQLVHLFDEVLFRLELLVDFVLKHQDSHVVFPLEVLSAPEVFFALPFESVDLVLEMGEVLVVNILVFGVLLQFKTAGLQVLEFMVLLVEELGLLEDLLVQVLVFLHDQVDEVLGHELLVLEDICTLLEVADDVLLLVLLTKSAALVFEMAVHAPLLVELEFEGHELRLILFLHRRLLRMALSALIQIVHLNWRSIFSSRSRVRNSQFGFDIKVGSERVEVILFFQETILLVLLHNKGSRTDRIRIGRVAYGLRTGSLRLQKFGCRHNSR